MRITPASERSRSKPKEIMSTASAVGSETPMIGVRANW
jgi:hypothetical protein